MAVTADAPAPYGPPAAVLDLIMRHRTKGLPMQVDRDVLARAGVSDSIIPRTMQTLQALDLIDSNGRLTEVMEGLRLAPESEFKKRMFEWLSQAYADALVFVDPATDDETKVRDAFRNYNPIGQQPRMVTLFTTLFAAAGVGPEKSAQSARPARKSQPQGRAKAPARKARADSYATPPAHHNRPAGISNKGGHLPVALSGLLAALPPENQGWTKPRRDKFLATFEAVLDFCFPIVVDEPRQETQQPEMEENGE